MEEGESGEAEPAGADAWTLFAGRLARADDLLARLEAGLRGSRAILDDALAAAPRRLTARLEFDSRRRPRAAGARAATTEAPRLRYRAEGAEIDLEIGAGAVDGRLRLLGQVAAGRADVAPARVVADGPAGRLETEVDDLGQFALDGLVPGRHRLQVGLRVATVEIADLEL